MLGSLIFRGLPEGIAQMRREKSTDLVMFGPRITVQRYRRRLIEVRGRGVCVLEAWWWAGFSL